MEATMTRDRPLLKRKAVTKEPWVKPTITKTAPPKIAAAQKKPVKKAVAKKWSPTPKKTKRKSAKTAKNKVPKKKSKKSRR